MLLRCRGCPEPPMQPLASFPLPRMGRRARRDLTQHLEWIWGSPTLDWPLQPTLYCTQPAKPRFPSRRRPRRLWEQQRRTWAQEPGHICQHWSGWPLRAALARPLTLAQPLLVHPLVVKGLAAGNVALQWRWMPWALPVSTAPCRVALAVMPPAHGAGLSTSPCAPTLTPTWPARCKGRFPLSGFRPSVGSAAACAASVFHAGTASTPLAALQRGLLLPPTLPVRALSTTCPLLMQSRQVGCAPFAMFLQPPAPCGAGHFHTLWPALPIIMMSVPGENS